MALFPPETIGNSFAHIEYDGFIFPPYLTARISADPLSDSSNRVTRQLKFRLSIETWITYDSFSTTDAAGNNPIGQANIVALGVEELSNGSRLDPVTIPFLRKITTKGKRLKITGLGMGEIDVNPAGTTPEAIPDLDNGPTPKVTSITAFRNARAILIAWECEFSITPCTTTAVSKTQPNVDAIAFTIGYGVAENGVMTRTISGSVTLPNWVRNKHTAINVDAIGVPGSVKDRLRIAFPMPLDCQRAESYTTSEDRTSISFTLTDTQIPSDNPYFPGTVRMNVTQAVSNDTDLAAATQSLDLNWNLNFNGTIEVAPGYPKTLAWLAIVYVLNSRLRNQQFIRDTYFQVKLSLTEEIFGRTVSFSFTYRATFSVANLFVATKFFDPINEGGTWKNWNEARKTYLTPYGASGSQSFRPDALNDYVVSICDGITDTNRTDPGPETPTKPVQPIGQSDRIPSQLGTNVSAESSYKEWTNRIDTTSSYNVVTPSVVGPGDAAQLPYHASDPFTGLQEQRVAGATLDVNRGGTDGVTPNTVQVRGAGHHYVILRGRAERVRYPIEIPGLTAIGPELPTPILVDEYISPSQALTYTSDGVPIYVASWHRVYCLPKLGNRSIVIGNLPVQFRTPNKLDFRAGDDLTA